MVSFSLSESHSVYDQKFEFGFAQLVLEPHNLHNSAPTFEFMLHKNKIGLFNQFQTLLKINYVYRL